MTNTLNRIERNLNRVVDIQDEVSDIMQDKAYSAQKILLNMLEACQDELETLIEKTLIELPGSPDIQKSDHAALQKELKKSTTLEIENSIRESINAEFGPRTILSIPVDFSGFVNDLYTRLEPEFEFRNIQIDIYIETQLPQLKLPKEILEKMMSGLIKNAIENTPDGGKLNLSATKQDRGILFKVYDFGVGIEEDAQKRIFEGFFATQETMDYSTKTPFAFNAGGKGADLLRMKIFSDRHGFVMDMESKRCRFLFENNDIVCPGNIENCEPCKHTEDCLNSGHSMFSIFFPPEHK